MVQSPGSIERSATLSKKLRALLDPKNNVATDEIQALISLTVDDIVHKVSHTGIPADDLDAAMTQIPPILDFLEACRQTKDPAFKAFAISKMAKLKGSLSGEKKAVGEKTVLRIKAPSSTSSESEPSEDQQEEDLSGLSADELFSKAVVDHISERLAPLHVSSPDEDTRLPYLYCREFHEKMCGVTKKYIVPLMLHSRRLRTYLDGLSLGNAAYEKLREDFLLPEKENLFRQMWEDYWAGVRTTLVEIEEEEDDEEEDEVLAIQEKNAGGMFGKLVGKGKKAENKKPAAKAEPVVDEDIFDLWETLISPSPGRDYVLPDMEDINLFQALFQYPKDQIEKNTVGVKQLLEQETGSGGRTGSSRDHMCKLVRSLPPYCGEVIAAWAYYSASDLFTPAMRHSFLASLSASPEVRESMVPYFYNWVPKN